MVDFSKYKIKKDSIKTPDKEISPDGQDIKIIPEEKDQKCAVPRTEENGQKSNLAIEKLPEEKKIKTEKTVDPHQIDAQIIDQKINEKFNKIIDHKIVEFERDLSKNALELMSIGAEHKLTEENIINYFKRGKEQKKYGLYDIFTPHDTRKVDKIVNKLLKEGILKRDRNNWYSLKPSGQ